VTSHPATPRGPLPAQAGIGLRAIHHAELLAERAPVGWLEAHSENYFADGGAQVEIIEQISERYPLSLHGVGLSLGSVDALDRDHLRRLKRLVDRVRPALVSEHVCWGSIGGTMIVSHSWKFSVSHVSAPSRFAQIMPSAATTSAATAFHGRPGSGFVMASP